MIFRITAISIVIFIATAINLLGLFIAWQKRKTKNGLYYALGMMGVTLWTFAAGLDYSAIPIEWKIFFAKIEYTGYNFALVFFVLFALGYAGYEYWLDRKWVISFFYIIPVSNILLAWTNDWHGWLWSGFTVSPFGENTVIFEHGPGYAWAAITGYAMIIIIIGALWQASQHGSQISRRQARLLFLASLIPVLGNIIYQLEAERFKGLDWTPITFSISSLLFLMAIYGTRLLDLVPIARHTIIEQMEDGVLVLDVHDRVVDLNRSAQEILEIGQNGLGTPIAELLPRQRDLLDMFSRQNQYIPQISLPAKDGERMFEVHVNILTDHQNQIYGKLILLKDVTQRHLAELELEKRITEIEDLNRNLRQTQSEVLDQHRMIAAMDERRRLARNMHDSVNQSIHSLMLFSETLTDLLKKNQTDTVIWVAERIQESGRQALREIRLMLFESSPQLIDEGTDLIRILNERLQMVESRVGINAEVINRKDEPLDMHVLIKENLYWLAIEALNNALKHAQPHNIKIIFNSSASFLEMEVLDDGAGFNPASVQAGGFGMRSMHERAEILGGELSVQSSPGHGTYVRFKTRIGD